MTLDIPNQGRGRPKKVPDNKDELNQAIQVWDEEEPDTDRDVFLKGCAAAALIGLTFFLFAWGIYAIGRV